MRADYSPAPGTTAYRVIAHMETLPAGAEVMTSALAEAIGVPANNLTPCLEAAVNAGKLFRRQRDNHVRSPYWWSLTDRAGGQPPPKRQTVYVPDQDQRGVAQLAARRAHNPEVGGSNPPPASTLPPEPGGPAGEQPPLVGKTVTVSMTGQVAVVAECGTVILFDGAMAKQLVAFCAGRAA